MTQPVVLKDTIRAMLDHYDRKEPGMLDLEPIPSQTRLVQILNKPGTYYFHADDIEQAKAARNRIAAATRRMGLDLEELDFVRVTADRRSFEPVIRLRHGLGNIVPPKFGRDQIESIDVR